jgi:hypothetical protein
VSQEHPRQPGGGGERPPENTPPARPDFFLDRDDSVQPSQSKATRSRAEVLDSGPTPSPLPPPPRTWAAASQATEDSGPTRVRIEPSLSLRASAGDPQITPQSATPWVPDPWWDTSAQQAALQRKQRAAILASSGGSDPIPPPPNGEPSDRPGGTNLTGQRSEQPIVAQPLLLGSVGTPPVSNQLELQDRASAMHPGPSSDATDQTPPVGPQVSLESGTRVHAQASAVHSATVNIASSSAVEATETVRARTRAVTVDSAAIILLSPSILLLIDEKIRLLREARENSDEAHQEIEQYEEVKRHLELARDAAAALSEGKWSEDIAVSASTSFLQGIKNWWNTDHVKICGNAFDATIFASCLGLCSLFGGDPTVGCVVSGAIAKGQTVCDALKSASALIGNLLKPSN